MKNKKPPAAELSTYDQMMVAALGMPDVWDVWDFGKTMPLSNVQAVFQHLGIPWKAQSGDDDFVVTVVNSRPVCSARMLAVGHLQNAWYRQHQPADHDFVKLDAAQADRIKAYRDSAAHRAEVRAQAADRPQAFQKKDVVYSLAQKPSADYGKFDPASLKGQQSLIYQALSSSAVPMSAQTITDQLVAAGFTCNQDPYRAIYYYLNEWKKRGWIEAKEAA
jgi:hypothetical protein